MGKRFAILAALMISGPVFAGSFQQVAYVDLSDLSESYFQSRVRIRVKENFTAPASLKVLIDHETNEFGQTQDSTYTEVQGSPLVEVQTELDEVDSRGQFIRTLGSTHFEVSVVRSPPPVSSGLSKNSVVSFRPFFQSSQIAFQDASGKRVFLNMDMSLDPVIFVDTQTREYLQLAPPNVDLRPTFSNFPEGQNYASSPSFSAEEQAVDASKAQPVQCSKVNEVTGASPLQFGPLQAKRIEICYPLGENRFQRLTLIQQNPPHEPKDAQDRVNRAALGRGGTVATTPILKLAPSEVSFANCHGYAIAATGGGGLPSSGPYWIQASPIPTYTQGSRPLEVLLQKNYDLIIAMPSDYTSTTAEEKLANDSRVKEGDLITFAGSKGFAHSGVIRRGLNGSWWVESKFEEGPVLDTPIASVHDVIPNLYTEIRVYRRKL